MQALPSVVHSPLFALAAAVLGLMLPTVASADVYKCGVAGKTVYQGTPCAGAPDARPHVQSKQGDTAVLPGAGTQRRAGTSSGGGGNSLFGDIRRADAEHRELDAAYAREVEQLRARARTMPVAQADREVRALNTKWQGRLQAASRRQQALVDELRRRCPGGASESSGRQSCRP